MEELKKRFPEGLEYEIVYDTTPFIRESINEVYRTLRDAVILVAIVVLVFLQNWRAAMIPLVAVPVAIVGTFAVMAVLGFSLNNLSLFGLVLAIGIVVDDAIVVVENVERWLEQGYEPREAARQGDGRGDRPGDRRSAWCSARCSCRAAFIGGITGQFFRQFAVTIAVSTVISAFNSLTLSPALAALLLRKRRTRSRISLTRGCSTSCSAGSSACSIAASKRRRTAMPQVVERLLRVSVIVLVVYGGLLVLTYCEFVRTPTGFVPQQDKGYLILNVQLPDSASVERTQNAWPNRRRDLRTGSEERHAMLARNSRRRPHGRHLRAVADPQRQRPEPRLDVRHAQGVRRPHGRGQSADAIAATMRTAVPQRGPRGGR